MRRLVVLSDLHLGRAAEAAQSRDLSRVIEQHAGDEIVLAGDSFDLSRDPPREPPLASLAQLLAAQPALRGALRAHLVAGHPVTLVGGNHDAALCTEGARDVVLQWLELTDAPLTLEPWFIRRGDVHVEHGHLYDPDNAPTHPLAPWTHDTEPLGIALTRRFLVPSGAYAFAHASETKPLAGLLRTFRLYGSRAPAVVARYFATAIRLTLDAGRQPGLETERAEGSARLQEYAARVGSDATALAALLKGVAAPRHHDRRDTFLRLYFDRVIPFVALVGATPLAIAGSAPAAVVAGVSAATLGVSLLGGVGRYDGEPVRRLRDAAALVADFTGATRVVMGHTHQEDEHGGYVNAGSFAYSRRDARPYLVVDGSGVERRLWPVGA